MPLPDKNLPFGGKTTAAASARVTAMHKRKRQALQRRWSWTLAAVAWAALAGVRAGLLDGAATTLVVPGQPAYDALPLTVECRAKLTDRAGYNILIAHETKASATHWELFTTPRDGTLHAFLPGRKPNHVHTTAVITDGQWHTVTAIMEVQRVRLFVDGALHADAVTTAPAGNQVPGPLVIGGLVEGGFGCAGQLRGVRLSKGVRPPASGKDEAEWTADEATIGLWRFDATAPSQDDSTLHNHGQLRTRLITSADGLGGGGMSTALLPLPAPADAAPLRAALTDSSQRLRLQTVAAEKIRDAVLRQWQRDFLWQDKKEYPEQRPGGAEAGTLKQQSYDPHALPQAGDGGPLGAVLRRTAALITRLEHEPHGPEWAARLADFHALRTAVAGARAAPESADYFAHYLAACALRRGFALDNPLLDFGELVCVARGTFAGSVRSNPATADVQGGHFATQYFGFNALPGGGLYRIGHFKGEPQVVNILANSIVQNGRLKGRKLDRGAFATPDLSFDGQTLVFAWTENREHRWNYATNTCFHLFKVNVDGSNLVQLTDGDWNDFDPCWLPDGRVAFISERRGGFIRCFAAALNVRNYVLCSIRDDGGDLAALSYFETSEWNPTVNNDGRLVFTRWDYVDRENCLGTRFWISNPDGTNPRAPHGNYPHPYHTFADHQPWQVVNGREVDSRRGTPLVEMGIRAVPGSPLYLFTAAPHHGEVFGSLCMLDLRQPDDGHLSQIRRITPDEPFPETETPGRRHYKYGTPWPLNEDFFLCNIWEDVFLLDRYGNKELLCGLRDLPCAQDERLRLIDPLPLRARPRPPVIPPAVRQPGGTDTPRATIAVMNVYDSDLPFPPGTRIKWLRVVQALPKTNHAMGEPMIGFERENTPRIPLGLVPVEEDGSAYFEAPVAKQLIFQALDENFRAVQSMRSVAFVHPGERLTCLGCHESPQRAAVQPAKAPLALARAPSRLQPECGPVEPVSYYRQIKPLFERRCLACHQEKQKGPQDMSYAALKEGYTFWFSGAMAWNMTTAYSGIHGGSRTIPGRFGALNSKIGQTLFNKTHLAAVPEKERHQIIQWLDCNSSRLGAYEREADQLRGELVWPSLDVDPRNVTGVEGLAPGLTGLFWHGTRP